MRVVQVVKHGHKIVGYIVVDNAGKVAKLDKATVTKMVRNGLIDNCKLQMYNGCNIVRIKDGTYITVQA